MSYLDPELIKNTYLLCSENVKTLMDTLSVCGTKTGNMLLLGATIGWSRHPQFYDGKGYRMLPRPVVKSRLNRTGYWLMKSIWFKDLSIHLENFVSKFVKEKVGQHDKKFVSIRKDIDTCKRIVPSDLRICETMFTSVSIIFRRNQNINYVHAHMDKNDVISCTLYLGSNITGGSLVFSDGCTERDRGDYVHCKEFEHGKMITGEFSKILHGAMNWTGDRIVMVFYTSRKILKHFETYGNYYYSRYHALGHPEKYISNQWK